MAVTFTATTSTSAGAEVGALAERDWALDPIDKDLDTTDDGDALFDRSAEGIASDLTAEFNMWLGEWYLDLQAGFPWPQILGNQLVEADFRRQVEAHALLIPGVVSVQNYALTRNNNDRSFSAEFEAVCDTGQIISAAALVTLGE